MPKLSKKNITTAERASLLSDREVYGFIFAPGFSTAAQVTNVSGRGVGMDVVKSNIEKIGGQAELSSVPGHGMTVRLKIPLTLAIVPAMIIRSGEERYAIPQVKLVELVRVEKQGSGPTVEMLQGRPVFRLRGNLLPLVDLREVLGLPPTETAEKGAANIVVLKSERQMFGLIVDEIQDTADIVVKPLSQFLKNLSVYSGATVLGDGSVSLILDVIGLSQQANLCSDKTANAESALAGSGKLNLDELQEYLLFKVQAPGKYAIPLNLVHRLEEFKVSQIEYSGEQPVVRYRGGVMPILSLNRHLKFQNSTNVAPKEMVSVIVVQKSQRFYGIEVDDILDVACLDANIDDSLSDRPGILGNVVQGEEVIVVIDILKVIQAETGKLGHHLEGAPATTPAATEFRPDRKNIKVLFAEDTAFFRKHVSACLQRAGFSLTVVNDGREALDTLNAHSDQFTIVLSDIEMPRMTGLELAKACRTTPSLKALPLVALTTRYSERHVQEGLAAGFTMYLEKMNQEQLIQTLDRLASERRAG